MEAAPAIKSTARHGRIIIPLLCFLAGFAVILMLVMRYYLIPAAAAAGNADPAGRKELGAISWLVMALVLVALLILLIVTFRPGRLFLPRKPTPPTRTRYTDAWTESGKRMQTPPEDDQPEKKP